MAWMLRTFLTRQSATPGRVAQFRNICKSPVRLEKPAESVKEPELTGDGPSRMGPLLYHVKPYQKYALVWTGKYKSVAEVPEKLTHNVLDTALNKARVKFSIYLMGFTLLACYGFVYAGKKMAKEGDSLAQRTIDHHAQLKEEARREAAAASSTK